VHWSIWDFVDSEDLRSRIEHCQLSILVCQQKTLPTSIQSIWQRFIHAASPILLFHGNYNPLHEISSRLISGALLAQLFYRLGGCSSSFRIYYTPRAVKGFCSNLTNTCKFNVGS
jgi:hypothetical protein